MRASIATVPPEPPPAGSIEWTESGGIYFGMKIRTRDGRVFTSFLSRRDVLGPENTMDMDTVLRKFHECAEFSGICPKSKADRLVDSIMRLDEVEDVNDFIRDSLLLI